MAPSVPTTRGANSSTSNKTVKSGRVTKQAGPQRDWSKYNHIPPNAGEISSNGRQTGRNLITWNRPHMAEKLLLHMEYELVRHRVNVPWDNIAHRLNPGSSGAAVTQYLHRLRLNMLAQGHMVPPTPMKPGGPIQDPNIRGYVRKNMHSGDPTTTRAVPWTEPMYDLKTPHSDAAWALDTLDAQEDSGFQENHEKLEHKGKKAIRPTRSAAKNICYAENEDGDVSEAIDEEAEKVENDQVENENEPEDGEGQDKNELDDEATSESSGTHDKDTEAVDTPFGTITPKRRGGDVNSPFEDLLNGAVLCTPSGRKYGFTDMTDLNVGIGAHPFQATAQNPMSGSFFTTTASSPGNWDLTNATPATRANMFAVNTSQCPPFLLGTTFPAGLPTTLTRLQHLNEWNVPQPLFAFQSIMNASGPVANANENQWFLDADLSSAFVKAEVNENGLGNTQKHK